MPVSLGLKTRWKYQGMSLSRWEENRIGKGVHGQFLSKFSTLKPSWLDTLMKRTRWRTMKTLIHSMAYYSRGTAAGGRNCGSVHGRYYSTTPSL
jgi:hypothetical protein